MLWNRQHSAAALALLVLVATAAAPAAAAGSDDDLVSLSLPDKIGVLYASVKAEASAYLGPRWDALKDRVAGRDPPDPDRQTEDLTTTINRHDAEFVTHTNRVLEEYDADVANDTYVLEVTVVDDVDDPSKEETVYVVASADGENVTNVSVVDSTNKTVDRTRTLGVYEARRVNEDLQDYYDTYVSEDRVPKPSYYAGIASKYTNVSEIEVTSYV